MKSPFRPLQRLFYHAELGKLQDCLGMRQQAQAVWPDDDTAGQVAKHRAKPTRLNRGAVMTPAAKRMTMGRRSTPWCSPFMRAC
jgi:hypothetical protein